MKKPIIAIALALALNFTTPAQAAGWTIYERGDEMTSSKGWGVESLSFDGAAYLRYPVCRPNKAIGESTNPSIAMDKEYPVDMSTGITGVTRVLWDKELQEGVTIITNDRVYDDVVFFYDAEPFVSRMRAHHEVKVEVPLRNTKNLYFRFTLAGATAALEQAEKKCKERA